MLAAACAGPPSAAEGPDASVDAAGRSDALGAGDTAVPMDGALEGRPSWLPPLTRACGEWVAGVDDPSTYDTRHELAVALAEAQCRRGIRCDDEHDATACDPLSLLPARYVLEFRVEDAERCLRAWDASPCASTDIGADERYVACAPLFGGRHPSGEACTTEADCEWACLNPTGASCAGTCVDRLPWPCEATGCGPGEQCAPEGCATRVFEGEPCDGLHFCEEGTSCPIGVGVCQHDPRENEPCYRFDGPVTVIFCGGDLLCDEDMICRPRRDVGLGEACGGAAICAGDALYCSILDRRCHAIGSEGDECDFWAAMSSNEPRCQPGLYCAHDETHSHAGTCRAPLAPGEACEGSDRCADGTACLTVDLNGREPGARCAHVAGPGCACGPSAMCPRDFECFEGTCERRGTFPHACGDDEDCIPYSGTCEQGWCETHWIGDPCTPEHFCFEGRCSEYRGNAPPGECRAFREEGEACSSVNDCTGYTTCNGRRCVGPARIPYCPPL